MPANFVLLERIELNDSASSVTFSNIPQTGYTDLKVVYSVRNVAGSFAGLVVSYNGSSTSRTERQLEGNGATAISSSSSSGYVGLSEGPSQTASTFASNEIYIPNYTSANYKSYSGDSVTENNATTSYATMTAGLWSNTAAITSIAFTVPGTSFAQYSTFSLYGLAATGTTPVIAPKASGGNITTDGTYWIHTFLASGTFTPALPLSCDYLVVAGGGAGDRGNGCGGGGGAGGFRTGTGLSTTATAYTITVGAGGVASTSSPDAASKGNNSVFSTITSTGGGGGGGPSSVYGSSVDGGSGGGGNYIYTTAGSGNTPSTSPSQGNNGGGGYNTSGDSNDHGGGGGGAGAAGAAGVSGGGGAGGNGTSNSYSGSAVTYAGGGGGAAGLGNSNFGAGGSGGGGRGGANGSGMAAGSVNTGGGGGGGSSADGLALGGNGGSGIVIIRYTIA